MALTASDKQTILAKMQQAALKSGEVWNITKPDALAAINATESWLLDNRLSYEAVLPVAVSGALNAKQEGRLLAIVAERMVT